MPARRPIRRSSLISPWGVGATVDFPNDESLMTCGLDAWYQATAECPSDWLVREERLEKRLRVEHFRLPPDYRNRAPGVRYAEVSVPFVRFPRWHYCPMCGFMKELGAGGEVQRCEGPDYADGVSCHTRAENRRSHLIPVRFVVVCEQEGHILDFPFLEWVHRGDESGSGKPVLPSCRLRLRAGRSSAGLSGIQIRCSCGAEQSMASVFTRNILATRLGLHCGGERPWLGDNEHDEARCGCSLTVLQRGASNVYFPQTMSSIYLPLWAENTTRPVVDALEDPMIWTALSSGLMGGKIDIERCKLLCQVKPVLQSVSPQELRDAAQRKLEGLPQEDEGRGETGSQQSEEEEYRRAEYEALRTGRGNIHSDLATDVRDATEYGEIITQFFERITLVKKLRETRALYGFSRYLPDAPRSYETHRENMCLDEKNIRWLPVAVTRGEGIFLELRKDVLDAWSKGTIQERIKSLTSEFNRVRLERQQEHQKIPTKFALLHTLAHLVINQLSYECGYGSSSLRERIYYDGTDSSRPMQGILIYTASGDSEGTMGGLVRQGKPGRIEDTLTRALRHAQWCSYDPVCVESAGQGPDSCNLAACHGCAILPETSCETGNRLLDRVCVVGRPDRPELGLFGSYLQQQATSQSL